MLGRAGRLLPATSRALHGLATTARSQRFSSSTFLKGFNLRHATEEDRVLLTRYTLNSFIFVEPLSRSLRMTPRSANIYTDWMLRSCLGQKFSYVIMDDKDHFVGFILAQPISREEASQKYDFEPDNAKAATICNIQDHLREKLWEKLPEGINKAIGIEGGYILPTYQGASLFEKVLESAFDPVKLKAKGYQGISADVTTKHGIELFHHLGFEVIYKLPQKQLRAFTGELIKDPAKLKDVCAVFKFF